MDMERRPFNRSNEPGLKKARLNDDQGVVNPNLNGRGGFGQRPGGANPVLSRFRVTDRESESNDLRGGGAYVPQPLQHHQELVSQYRTALAELTFNSKPIITNLTIIAGESQNAAKAITATICANIIEVPSEQKLPSLYLLDSIVKNIGRDYIKHFAARLPEVFCKAYRQVEPPIHQSMRHLFGTWKGVFPAQTLQMIEKELGFTTAANGSSSGVSSSRPDSQSQRPANSIHVNPKYLERQRLQQPVRKTKGMASDFDGTMTNSIDDIERSDRVASISAGRSWADPPVKMPNIQRSTRDALSERFHEKNVGGEYDESDYDSDLPRSSSLAIGRSGGNIIEQGHDKPWYGGVSSAAETISGQRNGFNKKHGLNYSAPKSANADPRLQTPQAIASRNRGGLSSSWKNSEEEEYMWDDMNSRLTDHVTPDLSSNSRKERWISDDSEKMGFGGGSRKLKRVNDLDMDTDIVEQKDISALGHRMPSPWSLQESHVVDRLTSSGTPVMNSAHSERYVSSLSGLSTSGDSSVARLGNRAQMMSSHVGASSFGLPTNAASGSNGAVGKQQQIQSVRAASPSGQLLMHQHAPLPASKIQNPRHYLAEQDPAQAPSLPPDLKVSQILGKSDSGLHSQYTEDSLPIPTSNLRLGGMAKSQPQELKALSSSMAAIQSKHHYPFQQQDITEPESSDQTEKPHKMPSTVRNSISDLSNLLAAETSGQSSTSSLLAAVLKTGILSNKSITGSLPSSSFGDMEKMPPQSVSQPPLPIGRPPTKAALPGLKVAPAPSLGHPSRDNSPTTSSTLQKVGHPPLPPGQPPLSQEGGSTAKDSNAKDPISNLLSSLVAKGLISASKSESTTPLPSHKPTEVQIQKLPTTTVSSISPGSASSIVPGSSRRDNAPLAEQVVKPSAALAQSTKTEKKNPIGFEFKPDKIRELHPSVIDELFDDLQHKCILCGLRLKLKERLDRHLEWHALKTPEADGSIKASRGWYANSANWVTGKAGSSSDLDSNNSNDMTGMTVASNEPTVPADESQCACIICGNTFEDFYCQESDDWMFKGAVYMTVPAGDGELGTAGGSVLKGPIVHATCIDENSLEELGLAATRVKLEKDD
uniref:polyadenylation and cleavage factor homolog 4-like isoform X1 n=1 Tax=Fragaria vesca subsp. vesca TaxID=101020 RepID=UPI0005CA4B92|nr:PREDICTED: polyadenylation and cleavage factor homolog 4-like isoform X1 [Fragaria vesca subsp. vesca]